MRRRPASRRGDHQGVTKPVTSRVHVPFTTPRGFPRRSSGQKGGFRSPRVPRRMRGQAESELRRVGIAMSVQAPTSTVMAAKLPHERQRLEDVGYMTCMTLTLL